MPAEGIPHRHISTRFASTSIKRMIIAAQLLWDDHDANAVPHHMVSVTGKGKPLYARTYLQERASERQCERDQSCMCPKDACNPSEARAHNAMQWRHAGRPNMHASSLVVQNDCGRQRDPERDVAIADGCLYDVLPRQELAALARALGHLCSCNGDALSVTIHARAWTAVAQLDPAQTFAESHCRAASCQVRCSSRQPGAATSLTRYGKGVATKQCNRGGS